MRSLLLAAAAAVALSAATPAFALGDPQSEARSALGACISAIADDAPVPDQIKGDFVEIRREREPETCTVTVTGGEPAAVRASVLDGLAKRKERFAPAKTRWDAGAFASREAFCNMPAGRAFNVIVSTAKPGEPLVLTATVLETQERDTRCDRDAGLQKPAPGS
ncbi:hypothetical protein LRS10_14290 [Phenylobacterium sp. J426]|uniref:hypothetical protein n=1 Tax=Phenylobacterium sp. J426 TaxID=2898439 RepID=UPI002151B21B|nr:hypothetical protein [Phenylobacterium sp. J426]MCR5875248.1 hypothetical protein [Phenylobacterium sp. J426]